MPGSLARVLALAGHAVVSTQAPSQPRMLHSRAQVLGTPLIITRVLALVGHAAMLARDSASQPGVFYSRAQALGTPAAITRVLALAGHAAVLAQQVEGFGSIHHSRVQVLAEEGFGSQPLAPLDAGNTILLHNYANNVVISTTYQTKVDYSPRSGKDERISLSLRPRRTARVTWTEKGARKLSSFFRVLREMSGGRTLFPLYPDIVQITGVSENNQISWSSTGVAFDSTTVTFDAALSVAQLQGTTALRRFHVGGAVAIFARNTRMEVIESSVSFHHVLNIGVGTLTLADNTPSLTTAEGQEWYVVPMMYVEIVSEPVWEAHTQEIATVSLSVVEVAGPTAIPPSAQPTGAIVEWPLPHDFGPTVTARWSRDVEIFEQGRAEIVQAQSTRHRIGMDFDSLLTREEWWPFLGIFDNRKGSWLPILATDHFAVAKPAVAFGTLLFLRPFDDTTFSGLNFESFHEMVMETRFITLFFTNGTRHSNYVISLVNEILTFTMTLAFPIPGGLLLEPALDRLHMARVAHMDDTLEEEWVSPFSGCRLRVRTSEALDISGVFVPEEPL